MTQRSVSRCKLTASTAVAARSVATRVRPAQRLPKRLASTTDAHESMGVPSGGSSGFGDSPSFRLAMLGDGVMPLCPPDGAEVSDSRPSRSVTTPMSPTSSPAPRVVTRR